MGLIGIKIRIAKKERIIPEFELGDVLTVKTEDKKDEKDMAATETEQIKIEEEKMKTLETLEEEEERLK
jgi:small subunit ribosomal protein S3